MITLTEIEYAALVAETCNDAYSADRYGEKEWTEVALYLLQQGFSKEETVAIMRSKHMRWAADAFDRATAKEFAAYVEHNPKEFTKEQVRELMD